ncbi:putative T7SS-secreted protein, partial [Streptomyces sp. 4N509B]|uniref:putative T7SS-secreted protein n=1 Tax=Streptomyces sp. 4N509B TaxID=3457413 RepID=UPI003FD15539
MARPPTADWEVLDLSEDPTPGNPEIVRKLANEYDAIADDAESTFTFISRVNDGLMGEGQSMEKLREILDELPEQVGKLKDSYRRASEALSAYAPKLETHQEQAARALEDGRLAKQQLDEAQSSLESATSSLTTLEGADKPDQQQIDAARDSKSSAEGSVDAAQLALDTAKRLALDAKELRESDARTAATELDTARGEAVKGKSFWDSLWDEIIGLVLGIVAAIVAVVAILVPPLAIVAIGVGLVLGVAGLGLTIGKGIATGEWDIAGIVLGVVGLGLGALSGAAAVIKSGGFVNVLKDAGKGLGNVFRPPAGGGAGGGGGGIPLQNMPG